MNNSLHHTFMSYYGVKLKMSQLLILSVFLHLPLLYSSEVTNTADDKKHQIQNYNSQTWSKYEDTTYKGGISTDGKKLALYTNDTDTKTDERQSSAVILKIGSSNGEIINAGLSESAIGNPVNDGFISLISQLFDTSANEQDNNRPRSSDNDVSKPLTERGSVSEVESFEFLRKKRAVNTTDHTEGFEFDIWKSLFGFGGDVDDTDNSTVPLTDIISELPDLSQSSENSDTVTALGLSSNEPLKSPSSSQSTLRPLNERSCPGYLPCIHGVPKDNCSDGVTCLCDENWTGLFCNEHCNLDCDNGYCRFANEKMFCNCFSNYTGERCEVFVPDEGVISSGLRDYARILAASLSTALAVAIILAIVIIVVMWRMRVLFVLKFIYIFQDYEDDDGKTIDAYVSMTPTPKAENFVYGLLLPRLENMGFKLYLQARDSLAGQAISETILTALENSRRTIMIVTSDYITNEWNRFEYLIAQHETLKLRQRIIPVILEDIEQGKKNMDRSLKHILDSIRCLKYPQPDQEIGDPGTVNFIESIQSPDSNRSADSTTQFNINRKLSSTDSASSGLTKYEKKIVKFWKRLELTMPKKKPQEKFSLSSLFNLKSSKYEVERTISENSEKTNKIKNIKLNFEGNLAHKK